MHRNNRPPTLHREDRTHTATDTQRHCLSAPGPVGGPGCGQDLLQGRLLSLMGYFCSLPRKALDPPGNEAPTISRRSQAGKWEWGQHLLPNPMVK